MPSASDPLNFNRQRNRSTGSHSVSAPMNERAMLSRQIADSQMRLGVSRHLMMHEDELIKCTVKFLVKFNDMLLELSRREK